MGGAALDLHELPHVERLGTIIDKCAPEMYELGILFHGAAMNYDEDDPDCTEAEYREAMREVLTDIDAEIGSDERRAELKAKIHAATRKEHEKIRALIAREREADAKAKAARRKALRAKTGGNP